MSAEPHVTFRHLPPSVAVSARVRELTARLYRFNDRIINCDVVIEAPPAHRRAGNEYSVKVELLIPGGVINASSSHDSQTKHTDVYLALNDAFDNVKRQLQDEKTAISF